MSKSRQQIIDEALTIRYQQQEIDRHKETIRQQQAEIDRLTEQRDRLLDELKFYAASIGVMHNDTRSLIAEIEAGK